MDEGEVGGELGDLSVGRVEEWVFDSMFGASDETPC